MSRPARELAAEIVELPTPTARAQALDQVPEPIRDRVRLYVTAAFTHLPVAKGLQLRKVPRAQWDRWLRDNVPGPLRERTRRYAQQREQ